MSRWLVIAFTVIQILGTVAWARTGPTSNIVRSTLMDYFSPYPDASALQNTDTLRQLLDVTTPSNLTYPPFPRTWIEHGSFRTVETSTNFFFDTSKIAQAISVFTGPLALPVSVVVNGLQAGFRTENSIRYTYNTETTFMAMTSMRPIRPQATQNLNEPFPVDHPEIRPLIDQRRDLRTYFKVSDEYPMIGLCKYEMSMVIVETNQNTLSFVINSNTRSEALGVRKSYTVFSNFFPIEAHIPVQEYLRTRCGEQFSEAVKFLVEEEFNKMVTDTFAHYHPQAQCRWSPETTNLDTRGDSDCQQWFDRQNFMGLDKNTTLPRCVLGREGFPVCAFRSKEGAYCPVYAHRGQVYTREPERWDRQLNPMENVGQVNYRNLYSCDHGLYCQLPNGQSVSEIIRGETERERMNQIRTANYITTCRRPSRHGR